MLAALCAGPYLPLAAAAGRESSLSAEVEFRGRCERHPDLGNRETVANAIFRLSSELDLLAFARTFNLGAMPYDMVEHSKSTFGEEVVPWIRGDLDRHAVVIAQRSHPASQRLKRVGDVRPDG